MPRRFVFLLVALLALPLCLATARPVAAQDDDSPIEIREPVDSTTITSLPRPNSGVQPERASERGGWLQLSLLVLFVGFGVVAFFSIRRQASRSGPSPAPRP